MTVLGSDFLVERPATAEAIIRLETLIGSKLPEDYRSFLGCSNGGEGQIGAHGYLTLWSIQMIFDNYEKNYGNQAGLREYFAIGSNGGGEALVMRVRAENAEFGYLPFITVDARDFVKLGNSFTEAIRTIGSGRAFEEC